MIVFHVDMDAFYASVEQNDNPEYQGKPIIVGSMPGTRGVVCTCSYEARSFGVRSAMPVNQAYKLCPQGLFIAPRMERYSRVSKAIMHILKEYTPVVEQVSIDEAYLDMSGTQRLWGDPQFAASLIKEKVKKELGLPLTIGIGPNRYVAKLASSKGKPNGIFQVLEQRVSDFLRSLPLKDLHGVGPKTLEQLNRWGIRSVEDLQRLPVQKLASRMGELSAAFLHKAAWGQEIHSFGEETQSRSLSSETTFETDVKDLDSLEQSLLLLCSEVMFRTRDEGLHSFTPQLKIRFSDFSTHTAQCTLDHPLANVDELFGICKILLMKKWRPGLEVRLLGVGLQRVEDKKQAPQGLLFVEAEAQHNQKLEKVEAALMGLRKKLPQQPIIKARLLERKEKKQARIDPYPPV